MDVSRISQRLRSVSSVKAAIASMRSSCTLRRGLANAGIITHAPGSFSYSPEGTISRSPRSTGVLVWEMRTVERRNTGMLRVWEIWNARFAKDSASAESDGSSMRMWAACA